MGIHDLLIEILERYPLEYEKNNKTSSPYYKDLKTRIEHAFEPLLEEFGLRINALGGMGVMRKSPYISFLAEGHQTNRGFYPDYHFDLEQQRIVLGFDDSDDNPPPEVLTRKFIARTAELSPHFQELTDDGYPGKSYTKDTLSEERAVDDLRVVFEIYQSCLDEFGEEIQDYLQQGKARKFYTLSPKKFEKLWQRFRSRIPDFIDFTHPGETFEKGELAYKHKALQRYQQELGNEQVRDMLAIGRCCPF